MRRFVALLAISLTASACGPSTNGQTAQEAGLLRAQLGIVSSYEISGLARLPTAAPTGPGAHIILVHGTPGSADAWTDFMAAGPGDVTLVALDRPGFGETQPKDAATDLKTQALAVLAAVDAAGRFSDRGIATQANGVELAETVGETALPERPRVVLVGHSLGGPIIAKAAVMAPEQIDAIVIVAGSLDPALEKIHWAQHIGKMPPISFMIGSTLRHSNEELFALKAELETLAREAKSLQVPAYIVHGTEDSLVPYDNVAFMRDLFPETVTCDILTLEGADHFIIWSDIPTVWSAVNRATAGTCHGENTSDDGAAKETPS